MRSKEAFQAWACAWGLAAKVVGEEMSAAASESKAFDPKLAEDLSRCGECLSPP